MKDHKKVEECQRTMTVVGIFDVGVPSVEKDIIYMSLAEAQSLFGLDGQVTEIVVSLEQIGQEPAENKLLARRKGVAATHLAETPGIIPQLSPLVSATK